MMLILILNFNCTIFSFLLLLLLNWTSYFIGIVLHIHSDIIITLDINLLDLGLNFLLFLLNFDLFGCIIGFWCFSWSTHRYLLNFGYILCSRNLGNNTIAIVIEHLNLWPILLSTSILHCYSLGKYRIYLILC